MALTRACAAVASTVSLVVASAPVEIARAQLAPAVQPAPAESARQLAVAVDRSYSPEVTAIVAAVGKPTTVVAKAGDTFRSVTIGQCGAAPDTAYTAAFVKENALDPMSLGELTADRAYLLPACLWSRQVSRPVKSGETPDSIFKDLRIPFQSGLVARRETAPISMVNSVLRNFLRNPLKAASTKKLAETRREFDGGEVAQTFLALNEGIDWTELNKAKPSVLVVPEQKQNGVIEVREGLALSEAKAKLAGVLKTGVDRTNWSGLDWTKDEPSGDALIEVSPAELIDAVTYDGPCTWPGDSPVSLPALRHAREENARLRKGLPATASLLIIDTGYDKRLGKPAVLETDLGSILAFHGDLDQEKYIGFNPLVRDRYADPTPSPGAPSPMHGSEVAATVLGSGFLSAHDRTGSASKLVFASIGSGKELKSEAAALALDHAMNNRIDIVNASFRAGGSPLLFVTTLKAGRPPILLITAAGNIRSGQDQAFAPSDESWPGRLGGISSDRLQPALILSIGAHDPDGRLLPFSRTGKDHVDLLAPGCNIPTFTLNADGHVEPTARSGTSFAAPIVSMIAADLFRERLLPYMVRNRLIYSAELDRDLDGVAQSSGRLNLRNALSVYRDLVEVRLENPPPGAPKTRWISGTVARRGTDRLSCNGTTIYYADIHRLAWAGSGSNPAAAPRNYIWFKPASNDDKGMRFERCQTDDLLAAPSLFIRNADTGKEEDIPLDRVVDFVARTFTPTVLVNPGVTMASIDRP